MRRRVRLVAAAALVLSVGCASGTPATLPSAPASSPAGNDGSPGSSESPAVPEIWDFDARTLDGSRYDPASLTGKKVAVWLWAPWCGPCNRLAPVVADISKASDDVVFLGVPGQDSDDAHRAFVDEHGLGHLTHVVDERRALWAHFGSSTQEAWAFVDDDGRVVGSTRYGEMSEALLRELLEDLREA